MDAEIANRVFGREVVYFNTLKFSESGWEYADVHVGSQRIPAYSTEIAAAWQIISAVGTWRFSRRRRFFAALREQARLTTGEYIAWPDALILFGRDEGTMPPFPLAICRAALATVEETP
jgi:hypothetical protein